MKMKNLKHLSVIGLALMLVFSSCTMEKRMYMSGYHIEWKKGKHNSDKQELVSNDNEKKTEQNKIATVEQSDNETNTIDNTTTIKDETITASADDKQIILPQKKKINLYSSHKAKAVNKEEQVKQTFKSILKKEPKSTLSNGEEQLKINGMALAGFICSIVGLLLVLITGWPFLLGALGVIFSAIGLKQISNGKGKGKGLAITGLIAGSLAIVIFWIWVAIIASLL